MKKLLALAGIVAGVVGPFAPTALAHPHDHECAGVAVNCYIGGPTGRKCDVSYNWNGTQTCVGHKQCTGTGQVTLSAGLYYPLGMSVRASITSFLFTGTCTLSVTGDIEGHCGNSRGTVTVNDGVEDHTGSYMSAGSVLLFEGEVFGVVDAIPALGESCVPGGSGADTFNIVGAVTLAST